VLPFCDLHFCCKISPKAGINAREKYVLVLLLNKFYTVIAEEIIISENN
jgi:hypothetical protein